MTVFVIKTTDLEASFLKGTVLDTCIKCIYIRNTCAKGTCIKDAYIRGIYIADFCVGGFWVWYTWTCMGGPCIRAWNICIGSIYIEDIFDKRACVRSFCAIKYSEIYLRSFWILKIIGGAGFKI